MIFWEIWGGSLQSEKFVAKKRNIVFRNEGGGGGQRPFGSFPKIHPKWAIEASLREGVPLFWNFSHIIPFIQKQALPRFRKGLFLKVLPNYYFWMVPTTIFT